MSDSKMTAEQTEAALAKVRGEIKAAEQAVSDILADGEVSEGEASRFATLRSQLDLLRAREATLAADLPERRLSEAEEMATQLDAAWREVSERLLARRAEVERELRPRFTDNGPVTFAQVVDTEASVATLLTQVRKAEGGARSASLRAVTMKNELHPNHRNRPPTSSTARRHAAAAI